MFELYRFITATHGLIAEGDQNLFLRRLDKTFASLTHSSDCQETQPPTSTAAKNSLLWFHVKKTITRSNEEFTRKLEQEAQESKREKADRSVFSKVASVVNNTVVPLVEKSTWYRGI